MKILRDSHEMCAWVRETRRTGLSIGLVPTMGNLHEGHMSLVRLSCRAADATVVSLFVNPIQFGPGEDFSSYPRTFDADVEKCRAEGVDVLFAPEAGALYEPDHSTYVEESMLSDGFCGVFRPGHFRGVCTVVAKLFNLVQPDVAVFGEKDIQQLRVIERMVRDLSYPIRILSGPTVREPDGLALSSRNRYLSDGNRKQAARIFAALQQARRTYADGERDAEVLCRAAAAVLSVAPDLRTEYLVVVDDRTLITRKKADPPARLLLAARLGKTRLIDNLRLDVPG